MGLPFVGMSRCTAWEKQAFRNLPSFWEFRKVLQEPIFKWRASFEERMDIAHDHTMEVFKGKSWTVDLDVQAHAEWSSRKIGRALSAVEMEDLRGMLSVRGVVPPPDYDDEPQPGPKGVQGGGGRKHKLGMRAPQTKRRRTSVDDSTDEEHAGISADEVVGMVCI